MRSRVLAAVLVVAAAVCIAGCSHDGRTLAPAGPDQTASIATTSTTTAPVDDAEGFAVFGPWNDGEAMGMEYTCDGGGRPPSFTWDGVPTGVLELALVMTDLDAVRQIHWVVAGIDPATASSVGGGSLPPGALETRNTIGTVGYDPPCPPPGAPAHRYIVDLYALAEPVGLSADSSADEAVAVIQGAAVATASLNGTYGR